MGSIYNQSCKLMRKWLSQPSGKYYTEIVRLKMKSIVTTTFGYHLLVIGEPELADCVVDSPINHRILIHHCEDSQRNIYSLCCAREDKLPLDSESIDIVYLAHCLELYNNPYEILREAYRVLRPEGRIIISGFNPWSILGWWCTIGKILKLQWGVKLLSAFKVRDWLQLLSFSHLSTYNLFYFFPISQDNILQKMHLLEKAASKFHLPFGSAYLIMAYKRVVTLTPIVPNFKTKSYLVRDGVTETVLHK